LTEKKNASSSQSFFKSVVSYLKVKMFPVVFSTKAAFKNCNHA